MASSNMTHEIEMKKAAVKPANSRPPQKKPKSCFKRVMGAIFSQLGVIIIASIFLVGGCFLFKLLEQTTSTELCMRGQYKYDKLLVDHRDWLYYQIYVIVPTHANVLKRANVTKPEDAKAFSQTYTLDYFNKQYQLIDNNLRLFRDEINEIYRETRYRGQDCEAVSEWMTWSAFLFSVSLLTTLGYGHVAVSDLANFEPQVYSCQLILAYRRLISSQKHGVS